ncbi:MAG: 23S rRNA (guanosine(2251)-2'-O)-methyltransferase RlmB [Alphaproteobacteria bacterium]|nr:23S rRNA (guanosine(2251)-2'-O)-methyltransferase RlmB [Alphaproteobacteria bacterium]
MGKGKRFGHPRPTPRPGAGTHWIYGLHPVRAALANPNRVKTRLVATAAGAEAIGPSAFPAEILDRANLDRLLPQGVVHQGVALLVEPLPEAFLEDSCRPRDEERNIVLVLDQVTDPHNVGAILRSAAAFGARAVVITERHAPDATAALAKSASGALDLVPLVRATNLARALEDLKRLGYWCVGFADQAASPLDQADLSGDIALVLGAEGEGLRRLTAERCDILASIPTASTMASLNVSNAAAVALYAVAAKVDRPAKRNA